MAPTCPNQQLLMVRPLLFCGIQGMAQGVVSVCCDLDARDYPKSWGVMHGTYVVIPIDSGIIMDNYG